MLVWNTVCKCVLQANTEGYQPTDVYRMYQANMPENESAVQLVQFFVTPNEHGRKRHLDIQLQLQSC